MSLHAKIVTGEWVVDRAVGGIEVSTLEGVEGIERYDLNGGQSRFEKSDGHTLWMFKSKLYDNVRDLVKAYLRHLDPATVELFEQGVEHEHT